MSALATGNYFIVNNVTTSSGIHLATNFNGINTAVNVVNFQHSGAQAWKITKTIIDTHYISPLTSDSPALIGMGDGGIEALEATRAYVWSITSNEDVYTITDTERSNFWDLKNATEGEKVILTSGISGVTHNWKFIPVPG